MKHAEKTFYLGGTPTTKPTKIVLGKTLKEMIARDVKDEEEHSEPLQHCLKT